MTEAHEMALVAIDAAHMAASQIVSEAEQAVRAEPYLLAQYVRAMRAQLREIEQSLAEVAPFAEGAEARVLNR
jgi:hypothetical protein